MEMQDLMAQAKQLQDKVSAAQDVLAHTSVKGIAENGEAIVDMSGKYDLIKLTIAPVLLERGVERLTAAVTDAFRDAKAKADAVIDKVMGEATAGMPLPE
ncbi:MAG: YbaB/EbfC family nucleoid-associated protein [Rickettsiales bacterium]|jgi:DNA-binding YbaB/EbfC family protein|nr:YbaB/EbfC family nucleoid-associated protein [Rickettsiales bacterium]